MIKNFRLFVSNFIVIVVFFAALETPIGAEDSIILKIDTKEVKKRDISSSIAYTDELPKDKLVITLERQEFKSGELVLIVPKLNINALVMNGTDDKSLKKGPGLYEYAQLPGEGNRNVSIAGHRDIYGSIFYDIDKLAKKDLLYLKDSKNKYEYIYRETKIIEADDWSVIYPQENSCLTLTSCHPVGVSSHRIAVIAELSKIIPLENLDK